MFDVVKLYDDRGETVRRLSSNVVCGGEELPLVQTGVLLKVCQSVNQQNEEGVCFLTTSGLMI